MLAFAHQGWPQNDVRAAARALFGERERQILGELALAYATLYTADELREFVKFFETPWGLKFLNTQNQLGALISEAIVPISTEVAEKVYRMFAS